MLLVELSVNRAVRYETRPWRGAPLAGRPLATNINVGRLLVRRAAPQGARSRLDLWCHRRDWAASAPTLVLVVSRQGRDTARDQPSYRWRRRQADGGSVRSQQWRTVSIGRQAAGRWRNLLFNSAGCRCRGGHFGTCCSVAKHHAA